MKIPKDENALPVREIRFVIGVMFLLLLTMFTAKDLSYTLVFLYGLFFGGGAVLLNDITRRGK